MSSASTRSLNHDDQEEGLRGKMMARGERRLSCMEKAGGKGEEIECDS